MSSRENLFERALTGELAWDAAELESLRREDPQAALELDELIALQGVLEARALPTGGSVPSAADHALVSDTLTRLRSGGEEPQAPAAEREPRRSLAHPPPVLWALAAALLLVVLAGWWWSASSPAPDDVSLGGRTRLEAVAPVGTVPDFTEFRVGDDVSPMDTLEIRIWAADGADHAPPIMERAFRGPVWTLTREESSQLPDHIRWEVLALDRPRNPSGSTGMIHAQR